jgi:hypothetical protein
MKLGGSRRKGRKLPNRNSPDGPGGCGWFINRYPRHKVVKRVDTGEKSNGRRHDVAQLLLAELDRIAFHTAGLDGLGDDGWDVFMG